MLYLAVSLAASDEGLPEKRQVNDKVWLDWIEHYQSHFQNQKKCSHCDKNARKVCSKWCWTS